MADRRDYRVRVDLTFPPGSKRHADALRDTLADLYRYATKVNEGQDNEEIGFISVERCGHRLGLPCEEIIRYEVGRGRTV